MLLLELPAYYSETAYTDDHLCLMNSLYLCLNNNDYN